jgi:hypothetical protein
MSKIRRGGFIFLAWIGDHTPRHFYREGKLVLKWDLGNRKAMAGVPSRKVLELINQFENEGLI